jgi:hypothetical protein
MTQWRLACPILAVAALTSLSDALAQPARVIVMRHGEKQNAYRLCDVGTQRAQALAHRYLGKGADASLFGTGAAPDAFFVITLHTLELASPAAMTWGKPLIIYSALPQKGRSRADDNRVLNQRTREAASDVMANWSGKTVVMAWEHHHIADETLEAAFPGEKVTLRQLLNLDTIASVPKTLVPKTWPGSNYDYFWIADYAGSKTPTRFEMIKQSFAAPYQGVPSNDWGTPNKLPTSCKD